MILKKLIIPAALLAGILMTITSCERYPDVPPVFEQYGKDTLSTQQRKVLIINVEGAIGAEVEAIKPPEIESMLQHSKYCWKGATGANPTNASMLESMFTGVANTKHKITDSSFQFQIASGTDESNMPPYYPNFFTYILTSPNADLVTTSIVPWSNLNNTLLPVVQNRITVSNDATVSDSAVNRLKNSKDDVVFVDFNSVNIAGQTSGFGAQVPEYKNAVLKVDGYIKNIMDALKSRPEYHKQEEWLVIVTSNIGGNGPSHEGYPTPIRNTFSLYYNEDLSSLKFDPVFTNAVEMSGGMRDAWPPAPPTDYSKYFEGQDLVNAINTGSEDEQSKYDIGATGQLTIQFKVKFENTDAYYPPFLSKTQVRSGSTPGWSFFKGGDGVHFWIGTGKQSIEIVSGSFDDQWHTVTGTITKGDNNYTTKLYIDGILNTSGTTANATLDPSEATVFTPYPLSMGYWPFSFFYPDYPASDQFFQDLRIWSEALPDKAIADNSCKGTLTSSDPYYAKLVGNWPCNEGQGNILGNTVSGGPGFEINGNYSWSLLGSPNLPCSFPISGNARSLNNLDVFPQIFYWLNIPISEDWSLDGTVWMNTYEREFVKL